MDSLEPMLRRAVEMGAADRLLHIEKFGLPPSEDANPAPAMSRLNREFNTDHDVCGDEKHRRLWIAYRDALLDSGETQT